MNQKSELGIVLLWGWKSHE